MKLIATIGDPNGIGIEVLVKSLDYLFKNGFDHEVHISGSARTIGDYLEKARLNAFVNNCDLVISGNRFPIVQTACYSELSFGNISKSAGKLAAESIINAVGLVISGDYSAMITMPISKESVYLAGWNHPGHTEMLAESVNISDPLMILFSGELRVALATVHVSLREVPELISIESLVTMAIKLNHSLRYDFGIDLPRIAILALNPHSGESGAMGKEEIEILRPAIEILNQSGIDADGPHPADGFFAFEEYRKYDGILAMYHDQGLIPLKLLSKGAGVNFTAGLPIVRTSPDHGSAFSIAGKNMADPRSSIEAFRSAVNIVQNRLRFTSI